MTCRNLASWLLTVALLAGAVACDREEVDEGEVERDTLSIDLPEDVDERFEEGARRVGGRVGEAIEETGQAIEEAGERLQEEAAEPADDDTL